MGLLDDAIREHLELKRKHGANPEDVARQEQEALGPNQQRAEFAQTETAPEEEPAAEAPPAEEEEPAPPLNEEAAPPEEPEPEAAADSAAYEEDPWLDDEPDEVPAEEALEQRPQAPDSENPEDVLEETPDFLQETPEHDRLWFEQKPPRDFDWDK
jgi:hypothetical protein